MINISDKGLCCGCWACANACPKQCINMLLDSEGFRYPSIDTSKCIKCNLCEKVCPILKPKYDNNLPLESLVVQNKDSSILHKSTSGGFFSVISKYVIDNEGVVYGASFDDNMILRHNSASTVEECAQFRGSKYVQSEIQHTYRDAKNNLDRNKLVLFSGTPCQIAGLYGFLGRKQYSNLITVDLVCRGTPSPRVLSLYLNYYSSTKKDKIVDYRSRDKYYGYNFSTATIYFKDKKNSYHRGKESDFMLNLYFKNLISRPSCYKCHFKTINRLSDFTIFDCWEAPSVSSVFSNEGATNVFIHSQKGIEIFDKINDNFLWAKSDAISIVKNDGIMLNNVVSINPLRSMFFKDLDRMNYLLLKNKYSDNNLIAYIKSFIKVLFFKFGIWNLYLKLKKK